MPRPYLPESRVRAVALVRAGNRPSRPLWSLASTPSRSRIGSARTTSTPVAGRVRLAMPEGDGFRFAEERRLFYVALTRARKTVHLIAQRGRESEFVVALIRRRHLRRAAHLGGRAAGLFRLQSRNDGHSARSVQHISRVQQVSGMHRAREGIIASRHTFLT